MMKSSGIIGNRWWYVAAAATLGLTLTMSSTTSYAQTTPCVGDCANDGEVTVDDIITMVSISLETLPIESCENGDANRDGVITIDDIIVAVANAQKAPEDCTRPPPVEGACGNGMVGPGEDCDNGGICTGGNKSGTACTAEADCGTGQPGVCVAGTALGTTCMAATDCPDGQCVRCKTFGGSGCAANCTTETDVVFMLVDGVVSGGAIMPGTSGATVFGEIIPMLPLPLKGQQTLTIGKKKDGKIPVIVKAISVKFPQIPVSNIACACVRGNDAKTCGGTLFELGGIIQSTQCSANPTVCPATKPCSTVHGSGNSASGVVGCDGLDAVDVSITQDCNGEAGGMPFPPTVEFAGSGPAGSSILLNTIQIGTQVGPCTATFCTDADPPTARGNPQTIPFTTGTATALVQNGNDFPGFDIGPHSETGSEFTCSGDTITSVTGAAYAGAFTACDQPTIADIVVTNTLVGK